MSGKPWFRFHCDAVDDDKLRLLAYEDRWHFVALLCCKGSGILDEKDPILKRRKVAIKLGLSQAELDEVVRRLAEVNLVTNETLQPVSWNKRQYKSDNSTERVRRCRERKKQQSDETEVKRFRNAPDTEVLSNDKTYTVDFEEFWKAYPKREGSNPKKPAAQKYKSALKRATHDEIMEGVNAYAAHCVSKQITSTGYVAQAQTWLAQDRWTEEWSDTSNEWEHQKQKRAAAAFAEARRAG